MKHLLFTLIAMTGLHASCTTDDGIKLLQPQEYDTAVKTDSAAVILDVRRPDEFAAGHLHNAILLDFTDTKVFDKELELMDKSKNYYIYCRSGRRSHAAAEKMQQQGFTVFDMEGGILNWESAGFPTEK